MTEKAEGYASRRNDVAHGSVRLFNIVGVDHDPNKDALLSRYYLVPTYYRGKRFTKSNMPLYAYRAKELIDLERQLYDLAIETRRLSTRLHRQSAARRRERR